MLYNKNDLSYKSFRNFLNETYHLTEADFVSMFHPQTIPIVFSESLNKNIVDYNYLSIFSNENNLSIEESTDILSRANNISSDSIVIALDEWKALENPNIIHANVNFILKSINENSPEYLWTEFLIESYIISGDNIFLEEFEEEDESHKRKVLNHVHNMIDAGFDAARKSPNEWIGDIYKTSKDAENYIASVRSNLGQHKETLNQALSDISNSSNASDIERGKKAMNNIIDRISDEMDNAPRTWLAKKVASLRVLYAKWYAKSKATEYAGQASIFRKIANMLLSLIDKGMRLLQKGANHIGKVDYRYAIGGKW